MATKSHDTTTTTMNEQQTAEEMVTREEIPQTPFVLITTEEKSFLTVGRYRVSPIFDSPEEAKTYIDTNMWELIFTLVNCIQDAYANATSATGQNPE